MTISGENFHFRDTTKSQIFSARTCRARDIQFIYFNLMGRRAKKQPLVSLYVWLYFQCEQLSEDLLTDFQLRVFFRFLLYQSWYRIHKLQFDRWIHSKTIIRVVKCFCHDIFRKAKCPPRVFSLSTSKIVPFCEHFRATFAPNDNGKVIFSRSRPWRSQYQVKLKVFQVGCARKLSLWSWYAKSL